MGTTNKCSRMGRNLLRVSKRWKTFLESYPSVWQDLDLSTTRKKVPFRTIKSCVRRSGGLINRATLCGLNGFEDSAIEYILARCKGLTYLNIQRANIDDTLQKEPLRKAIATASNLRTLILSDGRGIRLDTINRLLSACSPLLHLELYHIYERGRRGVPPVLWQVDLSQLRVLALHAPIDVTFDVCNLDLVGSARGKKSSIGVSADSLGHSVLESPGT